MKPPVGRHLRDAARNRAAVPQFHPSADSVTVSPLSSLRGWQSLSLQHEIGYQSWAGAVEDQSASTVEANSHRCE